MIDQRKTTNPLDIFFVNSDINTESIQIIFGKYKFDVNRPCRDEWGNLGPSFQDSVVQRLLGDNLSEILP